MRRIVFLTIVLLLSACSSTVENITTDQTRNLIEKHGYLLVGVELNQSIKSIEIDGEGGYIFSDKDMRKGTNYFLVELPEGDYSFTKVKLNDYWRYELSDGMWDFRIQSGIISYVGHLEVDRYGFWGTHAEIVLENRSSQALVFLEDEFPNILNNRKVRYLGPGEDRFFEIVENWGNTEVAP